MSDEKVKTKEPKVKPKAPKVKSKEEPEAEAKEVEEPKAKELKVKEKKPKKGKAKEKVLSPALHDQSSDEEVEEVPLPRATVELKVGSSLKKHGRTYVAGNRFPVVGEEQIDYFEKDNHFSVTRMK